LSFVLCVGEALIDFVAQSPVADVGSSELFRRAAGGAVANVAVGIARLGSDAHFAGTISSDPFGHYLLRTLAHEGVNVDGVRTVREATTLAFVARGEHGERDFLFVRNPGADSCLDLADLADLDARQLSRARTLHFGGVLLSTEPARSACLGAASAALRAGALVSFDANVRANLWSSPDEMRRTSLAGCARATLVKLSEEDAQALGIDVSDATALLNETTRVVVLTRGAHGATTWLRGGETIQTAAPVVEPIDTTGAGDAATAGILWRLLHMNNELSATTLTDAVRFGCAAGALACLREGAIPSLPTAAAVEAMLARSASADS
jgi:fructokinase